MSSSLNSRGCGIFSDRATLLRDVCNRAVGGLGPFHVVRERTALPVTRGELKSNGPNPCGRAGAVLGRRPIGAGG